MSLDKRYTKKAARARRAANALRAQWVKDGAARIPEHACPACGAPMSHVVVAEQPDEQTAPKPNDWTICDRCAAPLVFADDLTTRVPTDVERVEMAQDHSMQAALTRMRRAIIVATDRRFQ